MKFATDQLTTAIATISNLTNEVAALHEQRMELRAQNDAMTSKVLCLQRELGRAEALLRRHGIEDDEARDRRVSQRDSEGHHRVCVAAADALKGQ
jgi:predicted RNase H-like nuclease (RuvC/YqgF family)